MLNLFFNNSPLLLVSTIAVVAVSLYLRSLFQKHNTLKQQEILDKSQEKGYEIISSAIKKSEAMLGMAEIEQIKQEAESNLRINKFETELEKEISSSSNQIVTGLSRQAAQVKQEMEQAKLEFIKFLQDLRAFLEQSKSSSQQQLVQSLNSQNETVKVQISQLFEKFEQSLSDFLIKTQQRSVESIDVELKATRQLIDTYKGEQLKLIDENIIAMLERTLSLVLTKKLTLKDHVDLVYESLEKAKIEKFIV